MYHFNESNYLNFFYGTSSVHSPSTPLSTSRATSVPSVEMEIKSCSRLQNNLSQGTPLMVKNKPLFNDSSIITIMPLHR